MLFEIQHRDLFFDAVASVSWHFAYVCYVAAVRSFDNAVKLIRKNIVIIRTAKQCPFFEFFPGHPAIRTRIESILNFRNRWFVSFRSKKRIQQLTKGDLTFYRYTLILGASLTEMHFGPLPVYNLGQMYRGYTIFAFLAFHINSAKKK
jgi:hypothetical protein